MDKKPILFIVGPTAVGKTQVAVLLAKQMDAEIISCDAMQVYKETNIASAKPSKKELGKVRHHCLDISSVTEEFNVGRYREAAMKAISDIQSRNRNVVFCGGSGMYMTVMLDGIFNEVIRNDSLRKSLEEEVLHGRTGALHQKLTTLDPVAAGRIHPNDAKRIVRALEVCMTSGTAMSYLQTKREGIWGKVPIKIFALTRPREELYRRVEGRVEEMFQQGIVDEVKNILQLNLSSTARTLIGIPEITGYLQGQYDLDQAKYLIKLNTRHFVKRQLTWLRRDKRVEWVNIESESSEEIAGRILKKV